MKRKRLQHHTDIFCDMFYGWRLTNDLDSLIELQKGIIEFDFLNKTQKLNNEISEIDFNMFYEISKWFFDDLKKYKIETKLIKEAKLNVEFGVEVILDKKKSGTIRNIKLNLILTSWILTDEKKYQSKKEYKTE
ncbi:hypothetical protein [Gaetbulibacter jejuensis]